MQMQVGSRQFTKEVQMQINMCRYTRYQDVTASNPSEQQRLEWVVGLVGKDG